MEFDKEYIIKIILDMKSFRYPDVFLYSNTVDDLRYLLLTMLEFNLPDNKKYMWMVPLLKG
jgi:hypothetical protein